jgi:hypothetical protein
MTCTPRLSATYRSAGDCVRPIANVGADQPFGSSCPRTLQRACQPAKAIGPRADTASRGSPTPGRPFESP